MKTRLRKTILVVGIMVLALCLAGCGSKEPIVGTWKSTESGALEQFNEDGTFTYTNKTFNELGYLKGTWEKNEELPATVQADGKTWTVYLVINEARKVVGEGELGNKYNYDDKYGDYYYLVSGDEHALTIGAANIKRIAEDGELSEVEKTFISKRVTE